MSQMQTKQTTDLNESSTESDENRANERGQAATKRETCGREMSCDQERTHNETMTNISRNRKRQGQCELQ